MIGDILAVFTTVAVLMFIIGAATKNGYLFIIGQILAFIFSIVIIAGFATGALPA